MILCAIKRKDTSRYLDIASAQATIPVFWGWHDRVTGNCLAEEPIVSILLSRLANRGFEPSMLEIEKFNLVPLEVSDVA